MFNNLKLKVFSLLVLPVTLNNSINPFSKVLAIIVKSLAGYFHLIVNIPAVTHSGKRTVRSTLDSPGNDAQ